MAKNNEGNSGYISKELNKLTQEVQSLSRALQDASLEEAASIQRNIAVVNDKIVEVLSKGSAHDQAKADTFKARLEEDRKYKGQLVELEMHRRKVIAQLSTELSREELIEYSNNLAYWANSTSEILDKLIAKYPNSQTYKKSENAKSFKQSRQLREDQKTVIKVFLDKIFKQQIREQIENKIWSKGTPKEILAEMQLTAEEEARLVEFKDPITEEYIKYFVLVMMSSGKHYFDITTLYRLIKYTDHAETTDQEEYANIIEMSDAFQALLPSETIAVRDAYSRKELTVKDFSEMDPGLPEKFYGILEDIEEQREKAQVSLEEKKENYIFRRVN